MTATITFVVIIIVIALIFDYINGFHDAANSIATVVSTRVLSPGAAVVWAAFFNFIAFLVLGEAVAKTIGKDMVDIKAIPGDWQLWVLLCGLIGAIVWNLITWYYGIPSSSSHALVGGYAGAAIAAHGVGVILPSGWTKTIIFIVLSPLIGMVLGTALMVASTWTVHKQTPLKVDTWFRRLQLVSSAIFSYSHGTNDAQKVMGIIAVVLFGTIWRDREFHIDWWMIISCHAAIGLGTFFGGWRIVKTMGHSLTKLAPIGGFAAETGGGVTIIALAKLGIPVSTTHTITGAIVGVGATKGWRAVKWGVAGRILWAWVFTIPASALMAVLVYFISRLVVGLAS